MSQKAKDDQVENSLVGIPNNPPSLIRPVKLFGDNRQEFEGLIGFG